MVRGTRQNRMEVSRAESESFSQTMLRVNKNNKLQGRGEFIRTVEKYKMNENEDD